MLRENSVEEFRASVTTDSLESFLEKDAKSNAILRRGGFNNSPLEINAIIIKKNKILVFLNLLHNLGVLLLCKPGMKAHWRTLNLALFLIGLFLAGLVGTSTSMTFLWPAYVVLGFSGVFAVGFLFRNATFRLPKFSMIAVFALLVYVFLRAVNSPVIYFAREDVVLAVASFLAYAGFLITCDTINRRRAVVLTIAFLVVANVVFAVLQKTFGAGIWLLPGYERTSGTEVGGLFNQADHYASFLAATVPLWLGMAVFSRDSSLLRKVYGCLACISTAGMALAVSAVGWLVFSVGTGVFVLLSALLFWNRFKPSVRSKAKILALLITLFVTAGLFVFSGSLSRAMSRDLLTAEGDASLPLMWKTGIQQMMESPVAGTGSRSSYIYGRVFRPEALAAGAGEAEFIHNEFLQMLADYGIVGLLLVLFVLGLHMRSGLGFIFAYRNFSPKKGEIVQRSNHLALAVAAVSSILAILAAAMVDFSVHLPSFALLLAILLAVLAAPDPMALATAEKSNGSYFPGGGLLFATRAMAFSCGLLLMAFGMRYTRSEFHFEKARIAFEENQIDYKLMRHLRTARKLDPLNPFVLSLSAHAQVQAITPEMSAPARRQALEQAEEYFSRAQRFYPQDVFAAVGHSAVLDELGRGDDAARRIRNAREWAPLYGILMQAEGEHHLRKGEIAEAEVAFRDSLSAAAFPDQAGAIQGLKAIAEWKFIAAQNGIRWKPGQDLLDGGEQRSIPDASTSERIFAGQAEEEIAEPQEWDSAEDRKPGAAE